MSRSAPQIYGDDSQSDKANCALPPAYALYDPLPIGLLIYRLDNLANDKSFRVLGGNQAAVQMIGFDLRPYIGKLVNDVFQELYATGLPTRYATVVREGRSIDCGKVRYGDARVASAVFEVRAFPLPDQCVGVAFENVTEELAAKQSESNNKAFLSRILNTVADPIFVKDRAHRFTLLNDAFCRFLGHTREALIGKTDYDLFPKSEADVFREKDERVFFTKAENINEETVTDASGDIHTIVTKKTVCTDDLGLPFIVGVIRDVTEHKKAEKELKDLNATLEVRVSERTAAYDLQTQELARSNAELERFAYVASHDLQEPLRMVGSYVQLLARRYKGKLGQDADDFIGFAVDGVTRMKKLINDLLEYSRLGRRPKTLKLVAVEEILKEVLGTLKLVIQECGASITWTQLPIVQSDPLHLAQVFQNLIGNALKFRASQVPRVHITAQKQDALWIFSISDNGIGIDPQHKDRIFDVFQRLHSSDQYPGTGVGLAVCKKIIDYHGGRIWVESALGKGATFYFTLPIPHEVSS